MNNLMLNFLQGDRILDSMDADIYLQSLAKQKNFKKLICVHDVSHNNIEKLKKYYDYIVHVEENMNPFNLTYLAYYNWLCENGHEFDYVMQWDMRDVIIQKNPFEFMEAHSDKELFLVCEGMKIKENDCNMMWHEWTLKTLVFNKDTYDDSYVINGGTYGGKVNSFMNYCTLMLTAINRRYTYVIPDQAMLGFLYRHFKQNPNIMLCNPETDTFCATGEAIKRNNVKINFDGSKALNADNEPYFLFHQWDRTEFAEKIRDKFINTLHFSL
jgi:hypothetical protein